MKRVGRLVLKAVEFLAIANLNCVNAHAQKSPRPVAELGNKTESRTHNSPQHFVVCTGWHALCSASADCKVNGDRADCDCFRVNEAHIVETSEIQDTAVKRLTNARCTDEHPCDADQAPVCRAIKDGQYKVNSVKYAWVSTFSYRGWCSLLQVRPKACDQSVPGYVGDHNWAICDGAPCTENQNRFDPERPLSCQCRLENGPFLGANGRCTGDNGGIMSSSPLSAWDFQKNTYRIPLPGLEYVQGACTPLKSDPFPPRHNGSGKR